MKWYDEQGNDKEFVVSSRVRLARNLKDIPFGLKMNEDDRKKIASIFKDILENKDDEEIKNLKYISSDFLSDIDRYNLFEKHIISPAFVNINSAIGLIISDDESLSVMIGEEDHIRIQGLSSGLDLETAYEKADNLDSYLQKLVRFAYDENLGFLTECPTNLGTGLRVSAMVHIPMIETLGYIPYYLENLNKLGLTIRGSFGEGSKPYGSYYQISNQVTLGITEKEAINQVKEAVINISNQEKMFREQNKSILLEDKICRAFGLLTNAKLMPIKECVELSSLIRMGISYGYIDLDYDLIDSMLFKLGKANLTKNYPDMDHNEMRAIKVKEYRKEKGV